jgi:hypothetical protein
MHVTEFGSLARHNEAESRAITELLANTFYFPGLLSDINH